MFRLRIGCLVISALVLTVGTMASVTDLYASQDAATPDKAISFDIPAQPLVSALEAYAAVTGLQAIYDSELVRHDRSTAVKGLLLPDVALRVILEGTGLTALYTANAFAVVPAPSIQQDNSKTLADRIPYLAMVQRDIERAFCRLPETRPGQYRLALRFEIDATGKVAHSQLLSSTGDPQRDELIADVFRDISIEQPPPPGMPQPITMIVSPRPPVQTGDCRSGRASHD
jgi:TonB family protein